MSTNPADPALALPASPTPSPDAATPVAPDAPATEPAAAGQSASGPRATSISQFMARGGGGTGGNPPPPAGGSAKPKKGDRPRKPRREGEEDNGPRQIQEEGFVSHRSKIAPPSKRDPLSPDLEAEFNSMFSGDVLERAMSGGGLAADTLELESRHRGMVVRVHGDNVFFSLPSRNEGVASLRQFKEPPEIGNPFDILIKSFNQEDGLYEVAVPGASIDVGDWSDLSEGSIVEARITAANTGGLECMVNNIRGFIPASQVAMYRVENFGEFVGQKALCVVTEVNPDRRNLVLSRRAVLEREKEEARKEFFSKIEVGQTMDGTVRSIRDFGAFVELSNGIDGLIHISQLSWERVKHPSEVLQEGQKIRVKIDKIHEDGKIGLSFRDLLDHPWLNINEKFPVGGVANGVVSRLAAFGAFVKLAPGVEGLVHISELSHQRVNNVGAVLKEGQEVQVKILTVDGEAQRIGLSIKALVDAPKPKEAPAAAAEPEVEEPPRAPVIPRRNAPLKGGLGQENGGEQFGLKW